MGDEAFGVIRGAYAYAPGYRAYSSPYVSVGVGIGPRYGWYYE